MQQAHTIIVWCIVTAVLYTFIYLLAKLILKNKPSLSCAIQIVIFVVSCGLGILAVRMFAFLKFDSVSMLIFAGIALAALKLISSIIK
jgi:hypothetical protein